MEESNMSEGTSRRMPSQVRILSFAALIAMLLLGSNQSESFAKRGYFRSHFKWSSRESNANNPSVPAPARKDMYVAQVRAGKTPKIQRQLSLSASNSEAEVTETSCSTTMNPLPPLPGKKGACFTLRDPGQDGSYDENMPKVIALKPSWNYSWGSRRVSVQPSNIEFVPMIWGAYDQVKLDQRILDDIVPQIVMGQAKRLLAYNEPDSSHQAGMPVSNAIEFWPTLESLGLALGGPAPVQSTGDWITSFIAEVDSQCLRLEYVAVHWYADPNPQTFKNKMITVYNELGQRPLMLTEFAVADWSATTVQENRYSQADILTFMKEVLPWIEAQEWIVGYSWYSFKDTFPAGSTSALFDSQGSLTPLGLFYASVSPDSPQGDQTISTAGPPAPIQWYCTGSWWPC
jgi:hypothetical protein